jgi:hypothetical protein
MNRSGVPTKINILHKETLKSVHFCRSYIEPKKKNYRSTRACLKLQIIRNIKVDSNELDVFFFKFCSVVTTRDLCKIFFLSVNKAALF